MIPKIREKIKAVKREVWDDLFVALVIVLVSIIAFSFGRLSASSAPERGLEIVSGEVPVSEVAKSTGPYVASKTGSKYHLVSCSSANSIKEENKVYFSTKEEAEAFGYTPAANCKGI